MSTGIPYLDEVYNPITGCSGKGCKAHCWARDMVRRFPNLHGTRVDFHADDEMKTVGIPFNQVQFHPDCLDQPLHWRKPRRVGVCFMGDWLDRNVRELWMVHILEIMRLCHHHTFFTLTKQADRLQVIQELIKDQIVPLVPYPYTNTDFANVWHGVSITDQEDADRMIPELLRVPGKRWVSVEPMLGPIKFDYPAIFEAPYAGPPLSCQIKWVVLGCESGPKRRPCPHEWMIDVVRQCKAAGVPVYVKQVDMGKRVSHNPAEWPEELRVREK